LAKCKANRVIQYSNPGIIACDPKQTIKWDPKAEKFIQDTDGTAAKLLHYKYRADLKFLLFLPFTQKPTNIEKDKYLVLKNLN
jgi:hypothetical protein